MVPPFFKTGLAADPGSKVHTVFPTVTQTQSNRYQKMSFQWVDPCSLPWAQMSVVGGVDRDGTVLWVARAPHGEGSLIPGKWRSTLKSVWIR